MIQICQTVLWFATFEVLTEMLGWCCVGSCQCCEGSVYSSRSWRHYDTSTHWEHFTQQLCITLQKLWIINCTSYIRVNKNPLAWNFLSPKPEVTCGTVAIIIRVILLSPYLRILAVSLSSIHYNQSHYIYRVSQEERTKLQEGVPYVKLYRYNPKHLYPKLNGYGDNGKRSLKL